MEPTVSTLIDSIKPGEIVLLEHGTSYIPEFFFKYLVDYAMERDIPLVVDDNFDSLYTIVEHCRILGMDLDLNHISVVKTGGKWKVGDRIEYVDFHPDPRVFLQNYERAFVRLIESDKLAINITLGLENLLYFVRDVRDFYRFLLGLQRYVGNQKRKAIYILHSDFLNALPPYVATEMRRLATSIWIGESSPSGVKITVLKSPRFEIVGNVFRINLGGVINV